MPKDPDPLIGPTLEFGYQSAIQDALDLMQFADRHGLDAHEVVRCGGIIRRSQAKWGKEKFAEFLGLLGLVPKPEERAQQDSAALEEIKRKLWTEVGELELSVRIVNCIVSTGRRYVYELVLCTEVEWLRTKGFGRKSLRELREVVLDWFGLPADRVHPFIDLHVGVQAVTQDGANRQAVVGALAEKILALRKAG